MPAEFHSLPYPVDPAAWFARLRHLPGAVWLDSGAPDSQGRFEIMSALPRRTLLRQDGGSWWLDEAGGTEPVLTDPWTALREAVGPPEPLASAHWPFQGGLIGCFGYDLGIHDLPVAADSRPGDGLPDLHVGLYGWAVLLDNRQQEAALMVRPEARDAARRARELLDAPSDEPEPFRVGRVEADPDREGYSAAFRRVQQYLRDGDCYQVNLARTFAAAYRGDPWDAYLRLRHWGRAPHGAWLTLPDGGVVLSQSPERFLATSGEGRIETRPIKGTRPRGEGARDAALARELQASPKDRAENVMIVDLLRNDLGRVCRTGSVRVRQLFGVESFATVHHLVSVVEGDLAGGVTPLDALRACFPGGSITGAPKKRAMEIIAELEPQRRGLYCGAIGYIGHDHRMDTSITIRTAVCQAGCIRYRAGGGLVMDSEEEAEFRETLDKARGFLRLAAAGD